jgi:hypothetical protein
MSLDQTPWRVKKLDGDTFSYLVPDADIRLDAGKMIAHVVVSTPKMDRERDVLLPRGCKTAEHETNPIVLVNHNKRHPGIARAADRDTGEYTVRVTDDQVRASHYFIQKGPIAKVAYQAFGLIDSGALAGVSPGFSFAPAKVRKEKAADGGPVYVYPEWTLAEISHVPMGMNPDAITVAVEKGVGGEQLLPELKDLLIPYMPERKAQVAGGWDKEKAVDIKDLTVDAADLADADPPRLTPTTQYFHAVHEKTFDLLGMVRELDETLELEQTKAAGRDILWHVGAVLDICKGGHAAHVKDFAGQPGLPDGANGHISANRMAEWRIKAMETWDEYRHKWEHERAVAAENSPDIAEAVKFCRTLAEDRTLRTSLRSGAQAVVARLSNVKLVELPPDDDEDREWGAVAAKLDKALAGAE